MKPSLKHSEQKARSAITKNPLVAWVVGSLLVAALICTGITFYLWSNFVVSERQQQEATFTKEHLKKATTNVHSAFFILNKKLAFFGQNTGLVRALTTQDELELKRFRSTILEQFPEADAINLIPKGMVKHAKIDSSPLTYSQMAMVKQAERRQTATHEAIKLPQGWHLSFAIPVALNNDEPVSGTLLMTTPMDPIYNAIDDGLENMGKLALIQTYEGGSHVLHTSGAGDYLPATKQNVKNTPWVVEYTPSKNILTLVETNWLIFAVGAGITWLVGLAIALSFGVFRGLKGERERKAIEKIRKKMGQNNTNPTKKEGKGLSTDILDIEINEGDDLLGLEEDDAQPHQASHVTPKTSDSENNQVTHNLPPHIFRAYDIRGIVDIDITKDTAQLLGQAIGSEALDLGEQAVIIGRDARTHSPLLTEYLVRGIISTGCNVINIGTVPSPVMYFATETLEASQSGVVVTASHNGPEYNGFKIIMQGRARTEEDIQVIRQRIEQGRFHKGQGEEKHHDIVSDYIDTIFADVALAGDVSIAVDAGNGVTGTIAPKLFEELGCSVTGINCDLDGSFPNHGPDPTQPENLTQLIEKVTEIGADFGVAFDGDGDRLVVVSNSGQIIWPDRLLMLFAKDILSRNPGADVVYDVKCTRNINKVVTQFGGRPIMWKTGHSPMKAKMAETGALLGGEYSGHIFIKERWFGFDDGMYVTARLAEILSLAGESLDEIFEEFPELPSTPEISVATTESEKFAIIKTLEEQGDFDGGKLTTLDGLRVDFPFGWGIVRASNTAPKLTLRAEAQSDEELEQVKTLLTRELSKIDPSLTPKW